MNKMNVTKDWARGRFALIHSKLLELEERIERLEEYARWYK